MISTIKSLFSSKKTVTLTYDKIEEINTYINAITEENRYLKSIKIDHDYSSKYDRLLKMHRDLSDKYKETVEDNYALKRENNKLSRENAILFLLIKSMKSMEKILLKKIRLSKEDLSKDIISSIRQEIRNETKEAESVIDKYEEIDNGRDEDSAIYKEEILPEKEIESIKQSPSYYGAERLVDIYI